MTFNLYSPSAQVTVTQRKHSALISCATFRNSSWRFCSRSREAEFAVRSRNSNKKLEVDFICSLKVCATRRIHFRAVFSGNDDVRCVRAGRCLCAFGHDVPEVNRKRVFGFVQHFLQEHAVEELLAAFRVVDCVTSFRWQNFKVVAVLPRHFVGISRVAHLFD